MRVDGEQIRQEIAAQGARTRGRWIPPEVRAKAVEYVSSQRSGGKSWRGLATELDVSAPTLQRWCRSPRFLPVEVRRESATAIVVEGPHGVRVTGLTLSQVAELLRELS